MKAKQIIRKAAAYLGRDDVIKYIDTPKAEQVMPQTEETVSALVLLLNMVISELCASFVPMMAEENVSATDKLYYSALSKKVLEITAVYDNSDNSIEFTTRPDHAEIAGTCKRVEYKYHPNEYFLDSEIDYQERDVSSSVLAYGLAAECSLADGDFERACTFHDRYVKSICATKKMRNFMMMQRRWA